ncbi:MAG: ROK family protein [Pirellulaceae bacterium]
MSHSNQLIKPADANAPYYWGIDIGGTGIKIGLVDDIGQTLAYHRIPTRESEGPRASMEQVTQIIQTSEAELGVSDNVLRIGLGAPGPMDLPRGLLVAPPQLPSWWEFPIRDTVAELLGRKVSFLNDANAAAYGEFWLGSAKGEKSMVLLTLGTGVGGGIIVDGELVNGVNSCGSECGHILVDPSPTAQLCIWGGGRGHLEAYASASGVVQRTHKRLTEGAESALRGHLGGTDKELTAKRVYEAAVDGDALALEIVDDTAFWLGIGMTTLVHTLDPGSVVLGGAMNFGGPGDPIGERFREKILATFKDRTFPNVYAGTTLTFASLGADAGYLGVAGYARKEYLDEQLKARIASEAS